MSEQELHDLYEYFVGKGKFSGEEFAALVNEDQELRRMLRDLELLISEKSKLRTNMMWLNVERAMKAHRRRKRILRWGGVAAAIMIVISMSMILLKRPQPVTPEKQLSVAINHKSQVRLLLSEGNVVHLPDLMQDSSIMEKGIRIQLQDSGSLTYMKREEVLTGLIYNTLQVPRGN